jgi:transposase
LLNWVLNSYFYLPVYSPELNPDEYLNQDLKSNIVGKIKMTSQEELKKGVVNFLNKRKRNPAQVKKYFHHPKVKYAA